MGRGVEFCEDEFNTIKGDPSPNMSKPNSTPNSRPLSSKSATSPLTKPKNKDHLIIEVTNIDEIREEKSKSSGSLSSELEIKSQAKALEHGSQKQEGKSNRTLVLFKPSNKSSTHDVKPTQTSNAGIDPVIGQNTPIEADGS